MKTTNTLILIALSTIILGSCTMEKRLYNKGFHVNWNKKYKTSKSQENKNEVYAFESSENRAEDKNENSMEDLEVSLNDGELMSSSPLEREMDLTQTTAIITESGVLGATRKIEAIAQENSVNRESIKQGQRKAKTKSEGEGSSSSGKSQIVALVLVLLVGLLGIHRFYLGHIGVGVLMLLTGGLCGILALIDLIRIVTGDLKPKYEDYSETL